MLPRTLLLLLLTLGTASAQIINIANPSFEDDPVTQNTLVQTTPTGWVAEGTFAGFLFNSTTGFSGWPGAQAGEQYFDIGNMTAPGFSTPFTVDTFALYQFTWWENTFNSTVSNAFYTVSILDNADQTIATSGFAAQNNFVWTQESLQVVLTPGSYTLNFAPNDVLSGNDALIDNIQASAVPEPSTWGVLLGLIAIGLAARRKS